MEAFRLSTHHYVRYVCRPLGFSIESEIRLYAMADREALGQYVVRGANSAEKIRYDPDTEGKSETFKGFEFIERQPIYHQDKSSW